jgi:prephenate dehydratase
VTFQGEEGAFSQVAVEKLVGKKAELVPCQRFEQVFRKLARGTVEHAVVPIENTLHGSVLENYDHLVKYRLPVIAETKIRIVHNLIALPGTKFDDIRRVYSHPVALNQCLRFLGENPQLERVAYYDTAGSVKMLREEGLTDAAAIASSVAGRIYGARVLRRSIEDNRFNYTRFFLLGRRRLAGVIPEAGRKGHKMTLAFTTRNMPGSLFRALSAFALRDISLTKIESRPLPGKPWEYRFYVDLLGRLDDAKVKNALRHLRELADSLHVIGCYPRGA